MARLCIRIQDNFNPSDPSLNAMRTQLGDVVCVEDDGHVFSAAERNCGQYRFIDVPGVSQEMFNDIVAAKQDAQGNMVARRIKGLDSLVLKSGAWAGKVTATKAQIDLITVTKA